MAGSRRGSADGSPTVGELLSPAELALLGKTRLSLRHPRGSSFGGHLSRRTGTSLEFADHRPYQPGDDLRLVDWAVYARHQKLMTKVFSREVEAPLYILLDTSNSMGLGGKLRFSSRLAAALCFLAFRAGDRFGVYPFGERLEYEGKPSRRKTALVRAFSQLASLTPAGKTDFPRALTHWAQTITEPGICLVISDFLAPGYAEGLRALRYGRHAVAAVQVLAKEDVAPELAGEVRLWDVEERRGKPLVVGRSVQRAYQEALARWNRALAESCQELGVAQFLFMAEGSPVGAALELVRRWRP